MGLDFDIVHIIKTITVWAIPVLMAITLHEAAHGFVAKRFGDATAWAQGRVTLNPMKHIDPFGTVILPLVLALMHAPILGYAKPVPVDYNRLKPMKRGIVLVALAGPAANLLLVLLSIPLLYIAVYLPLPEVFAVYFVQVAMASITVNLLLMLFNLMPIPPLDGSKVLQVLLPGRLAYYVSRYEWMGMFVLLFLMFTGVLFPVLRAMIGVGFQVILPLLPRGFM